MRKWHYRFINADELAQVGPPEVADLHPEQVNASISEEGIDASVVRFEHGPQHYRVKARDSIQPLVYLIADQSSLPVESPKPLPEQPLHRQQPLINRTCRENELRAWFQSIECRIQKGNRIVRESLRHGEQRRRARGIVEQVHQSNGCRSRLDAEQLQCAVQRCRACARQADAKYLGVMLCDRRAVHEGDGTESANIGNRIGHSARLITMKHTPPLHRSSTIMRLTGASVTLLLLASACGDTENITSVAENPATTSPGNVPPDTSVPGLAPEPTEHPVDGSTIPADEAQFIGLTENEAGALADSQSRRWRTGRVDNDFRALTEDFVIGRVTFEVDDGLVTSAGIERDLSDTAGPPTTVIGPAPVELVAGAIVRLITDTTGPIAVS